MVIARMGVRRPSFMILGAAKCGTTSLNHYLAQHPDVFLTSHMPYEPLFFESEYERGLEYYWRKYYAAWSGEKAVGEARPANLFLPFVPERIRESVPDARFLVVLRNPVDRAFSLWWQRYSNGIEELPFEEALEKNLEQVRSGVTFEGAEGARLWKEHLSPMGGIWGYRLYLDLGYYAGQLKRYFEHFDREQFEIFLYEDLCRDPQEVVARAWRHIGVDPRETSIDRTPQNVASTWMAGRLRRSFRRNRLLRRLPDGLKQRVLDRAARVGSKPEASASARCSLAEHYRPHNRELEGLLGRDLRHWSSQPDAPL